MKALGIDLKEHAPTVLQYWTEMLGEFPDTPPDVLKLEGLTTIIIALVEASLLSPHDLACHRSKIDAALKHGEQMRRLGHPERFIFEEFAALREALRRYLEACGTTARKRREALMRLDMASSVAELAVIRGYHRATLEEAGVWETLTLRLAESSPLLGLPEPD